MWLTLNCFQSHMQQIWTWKIFSKVVNVPSHPSLVISLVNFSQHKAKGDYPIHYSMPPASLETPPLILFTSFMALDAHQNSDDLPMEMDILKNKSFDMVQTCYITFANWSMMRMVYIFCPTESHSISTCLHNRCYESFHSKF